MWHLKDLTVYQCPVQREIPQIWTHEYTLLLPFGILDFPYSLWEGFFFLKAGSLEELEKLCFGLRASILKGYY